MVNEMEISVDRSKTRPGGMPAMSVHGPHPGLWLNLTCLHGNIRWYCHRQVHVSTLIADIPHTRVANSVSRIMVWGRGCPVMGSRQMRAQKGTILVVHST
jgi:hypothetical protein